MEALSRDTAARALTDKLQEQIPGLMAAEAVPGLSLVLLREGEIFWHGVFGVESSLTGEPVTADTMFEAASLSKPVFAYAALKLCETGTLDLDEPLAGYIAEPYLPDEPRLDLLTARQVLCHTSGFPNWRPKGEPLKMHLTPGERFSYSGEGYMYLQAALAEITGQEPAAFLRESLLGPLGMGASSFLWTGEEGLPIAVGHDQDGKAQEKYLWQEVLGPASLHCTPEDYALFMSAVMRPSPDVPAHLGREMTGEMLRVQVQVNDSYPWDEDWPRPQIRVNPHVGWGLGWGIQHTSGGESIWHWGDNGNYRAFALGYPESGHGLVVMTNGVNGQKVIDRVLYDVIGGKYPGLDWLYDRW